MKYFLMFFSFALARVCVGQTDGWNPDYNADNFIGVSDVLGVLSVFSSEWDSDSIVTQSVGADYIASADTSFMNNFSLGLTNAFTIQPLVDILLVHTDELRLGLAETGSQDNKSLTLQATLPAVDGYKQLLVGFTAEELEYNGTSVNLEIYDEQVELEDLGLNYGTNRLMKFYCLAGTWFREHY